MGCAGSRGVSSAIDLVLPGITLPADKSVYKESQTLKILFDLELPAVKKVASWVLKSFPKAFAIIGKPKSDKECLKRFQSFFVENVIQTPKLLPPDYNFFGNDNTVEILSHFLRSNSFFASALIASNNEEGKTIYEVISKPLNPNEKTTFFSQLIQALNIEYLRVNAQFDENMNLIKTECYLKDELQNKTNEEACAQLLFLFLFYSECLHANLHIYHMMMVCAMADSVILVNHPKEQPSEIYHFMNSYFPNVALKFKEVDSLLLGKTGALVGKHWKAERNQVLMALKDIFLAWGACKTAEEFVNNFLLRNVAKEFRQGVLEEYRKHAELIKLYAKEINDEFLKMNLGKDLKDVNENIDLFFSKCGETPSKIQTAQEWIELMSVTGMMHTNTLSFSRLILTQPVLSKFSPGDEYGILEFEAAFNTCGTIVGALPEKIVFNGYHSHEDPNNPHIKFIKSFYTAASHKLKKDYFERMKEDPCFKEYGWIISDYFLDGIDGKYFTITTYI